MLNISLSVIFPAMIAARNAAILPDPPTRKFHTPMAAPIEKRVWLPFLAAKHDDLKITELRRQRLSLRQLQ